MTRRFVGPVVVLVVLLSSLAVSSSAQDWEQNVREQIDRMVAEFRSRGYETVGEITVGSAGAGQTVEFDLPTRAGQSYAVAGACDQDCTDLDLVVYAPGGAELGADRELDAIPIVGFDAVGGHRVGVHMVSCAVEPCFFGFALLTSGGAAAGAGTSGGGSTGWVDGPTEASGDASPGGTVWRGDLSDGDEMLDSGEFFDRYVVEGAAGQTLVAELTSTEFDPFLIVAPPGVEALQNDDYEGDATRSLLRVELTQSAPVQVLVTSFKPGERGSYTLSVNAPVLGGGGVVAGGADGRLAPGDQQLNSGEYVDVHTLTARAGETIRATVTSTEFDTYLMVIGPDGQREENDDTPEGPGTSRIEMVADAGGEYRVMVTSYAVGETGAYDLSMNAGAGPVSGAGTAEREAPPLRFGAALSGSLAGDDPTLDDGEYYDVYTFDGVAGQSVAVEMLSDDFDTYVGVRAPDGTVTDNDDWEGRTDMSRVELRLEQTGSYRVAATSYAGGATGNYRLELTEIGETPTRLDVPTTAGATRVLGLFVGISDYGGRASDLAYTAADAERVAAAFARGARMGPDDSVVLTDSQATVSNFTRSLRDLAGRAGPNDMLVLFYSGHGGRVDRGGFEPTDPDGIDETLVLYDGDISDNDMAGLLDMVNARVSLLMLDSCFSGGFAKDVISRPGRMGLFSSEEDVTSSVAAKFRAGGYLAHFVAEAIGDWQADADGNRQLTAIELSQYLHERYRVDVKSAEPGEFVRTGGPSLGHQHLVVDRGSIGPEDVLIR